MEAHTFDCDSALEHLGGYEIVANTYKQTMNLPQTDFPMRANLAQNEPARLQWWDDIDIYHKVLEKNADGEPFVLHDGPPYANGPIHIGHAFNKILKDFVNKSHAQRGFFTPYIPGWDCHGQPIEHEVEKKIGTEKMNSLPQDVIRRMCREWADRFVNVQREGFKRLGMNRQMLKSSSGCISTARYIAAASLFIGAHIAIRHSLKQKLNTPMKYRLRSM